MRILLAHNYYQQPGGEDQVFENEAQLLQDHGHEVVRYIVDNEQIKGMNRARLAKDLFWSKKSARDIRSLIHKQKPDIAHFHNIFPLISPSAYYACQDLGVPVVQTLHNYRLLCPAATFYRDGGICEDCLGKSFAWPGILHSCYRDSFLESAGVAAMTLAHRLYKTWDTAVDQYIALTEFARNKFVEGGLPENKICVKPNFLSEVPGMGDHDGKYALFVGRLTEEKGIHTLLFAWKEMDHIPIKIVGDGPLFDDLYEDIQILGLKNITIFGQVSHSKVMQEMKNASFLVFPSAWYEGFPMTIVEAFACGLPVIASDIGSLAELVEDHQTGLIFEARNGNDLARKVNWAWEHQEKMKKMGQHARCEFKENYTADKNYDLLMDIYESVLGR